MVGITIDRPMEGRSLFLEYSVEIKDARPELGPMLSLVEHTVGIAVDRPVIGAVLSIIDMQSGS